MKWINAFSCINSFKIISGIVLVQRDNKYIKCKTCRCHIKVVCVRKRTQRIQHFIGLKLTLYVLKVIRVEYRHKTMLRDTPNRFSEQLELLKQWIHWLALEYLYFDHELQINGCCYSDDCIATVNIMRETNICVHLTQSRTNISLPT